MALTFSKELERRKKFQDLYGKIIKQNIPALGSPDAEVNHLQEIQFHSLIVLFQEGPHSTLKEDEFYDAIDQSLDRIDRETDDLYRSVSNAFSSFLLLHTLLILKTPDSLQDKNETCQICC